MGSYWNKFSKYTQLKPAIGKYSPQSSSCWKIFPNFVKKNKLNGKYSPHPFTRNNL